MRNDNMLGIKIRVSVIVMVLSLASCGSDEVKQDVPDCVFPDAPTAPAPGWVCDEPVAGIEVSHKGEFTGELPGEVIRGSQKLN